MKKQVKIKDIKIGDSFSIFSNSESYIKIDCKYLGELGVNIVGVCFALCDNRVVIIKEDATVYIDVLEIHYRDIKVGEKFKVGQSTYLKVNNMMKDRLGITANPCVCIGNSFLYNCEDDIQVERV